MALLGDHFDLCSRCSGYVIINPIYRSMMRNSPALCRCDELASQVNFSTLIAGNSLTNSADRPEAKKSVTHAEPRRKLTISTRAAA